MFQRSLAIVVLAIMSGCPADKEVDVPCERNEDCDLTTGGICKAAPSGNQWCAYPDSSCESGIRFSDVNVGDDLAGTCTEVEVYKLTVSIGGSTNGTVTSTPSGLDCASGSCEYSFPIGSQVELDANATNGAFLGWSDGCTGFSSCTITMDSDKQVGALFGVPGQALWVQHAGASGDDLGRGIAADGSDRLVVVGDFRNTIDLGGTMLTSAGGTDIFVAKLDALTGAVVWAKRFGGTGDDSPSRVAVDSAHGIYISGTYTQTVDFGGGAFPSAGTSADGYLVKLDGDGAHVWSKSFSGSGFNIARSVAVRESAVVVTGQFGETMNANGTTYTVVGSTDTFVMAYNLSGALTWAKTVGGADVESPTDTAIDSDGNVIVVGRFSGTSNFGGSNIASAGFEDGFIAKYGAATGAHLFSKKMGGTAFDFASAVAVDDNDGIFVIGSLYGTFDFGGPAPVGIPDFQSSFLVKFNLAGAFSWGKAFGQPGKLQAFAVTSNTAGDVAISGGFCGTVSLGGADLVSVRTCAENDQDIFAARFSGTNGDHLKSTRAGGTALDDSRAIAQMPDGRVFVTGGFQGFAEFGGEALTSSGGYDAVVLGLAPL